MNGQAKNNLRECGRVNVSYYVHSDCSLALKCGRYKVGLQVLCIANEKDFHAIHTGKLTKYSWTSASLHRGSILA